MSSSHRLWLLVAFMLFAATPVPGLAGEGGWIDLSSDANALKAWEEVGADWMVASSVEMDAKNPRRLAAKPGEGILVNSPKGRAPNLITKQEFTDAEVHVDFMVPKGSNSGVKLMGLYEIQIFDSFGVKDVTGADCGGIYPRAEDEPTYHHTDNGVPPKINACKRPGEWQTLDIIFRAPRFDAKGKKIEDARFIKVVLNGTVVHDNVDVKYPTGSAWRLRKEIPTGPLLLQGDHGPVAFRNVRIRPYSGDAEKEKR